LSRLLRTVFDPKKGERICILIDLENPRGMKDFSFLGDRALSIQRHAHDVFFQGLHGGVLGELGLGSGAMFAYQITGGSNLDLPVTAWDASGRELRLIEDVLLKHDIVLCISTFSAT